MTEDSDDDEGCYSVRFIFAAVDLALRCISSRQNAKNKKTKSVGERGHPPARV